MMLEAGREQGVAVVLALMVMLVMSALGSALVVATAVESRITRNFRNGAAAFYAADAALEYSIGELESAADWNTLLAGGVRSFFVDGSPHGARTLVDGTSIDLDRLVNDVNCRRATACSDSAMDAITSARPWGANNPRWQLFAWGPLDQLAPAGAIGSPFYVAVLIADDPSECDDNPLVDGGPIVSCTPGATENPGAGVLMLRGEAFGPFGSHKVIEVTIARAKSGDVDEQSREGVDTEGDLPVSYNGEVGQAGVHVLSWHELR
jgi:PilX N-terminal